MELKAFLCYNFFVYSILTLMRLTAGRGFSMAKKEANFDLFIHDLLVEAGISADTQGSNVVDINNALKTASKHQTGKAGFPEYTANKNSYWALNTSNL